MHRLRDAIYLFHNHFASLSNSNLRFAVTVLSVSSNLYVMQHAVLRSLLAA